MSYLALARKWRPKTFDDTVGQEHVLQALVNALDTERLHHAYLFTGTRGVGKTTSARILAKSLNCETGVTSKPCGVCSACVEIDEGRFVDLIEVDAASKTKVDDTRELLDNVQYAPTRGRYKVYLIDEVHMLSTSSFNALLKTLEEPPPHVKFLLATTDPQKLPVTVLSRCLQFNLQRLTRSLIADRLVFIAREEDIEADADALGVLARAADGSLRDALSLLDQSIAYCGGAVTLEGVNAMLGTIDRDYVVRLLDALAAADPAALMDAVDTIDRQFPDYARLLDDLARVLQKIAVFQAVGGVETEGDVSDEVLDRFAGLLSSADIQLYYQTAITGRRDLDLAPDPRSGAEMCLLRMLVFRPADAQAPDSAGGSAPVSVVSNAPAPAKKTAIKAEPATPAPSRPAAKTSLEALDWHSAHTQLGLQGLVRMLATNCAFERRDGNTLYFSLDKRSESFLTRQRQGQLAKALSDYVGESVRIEITVADTDTPATPQQEASRMADERIEQARQSLESDPNVQALKSVFGAEINTETIKPHGD
ncbi:MAG: DNA polymerase III subunit gamma/tau [Pseudomonadota bacterium]